METEVIELHCELQKLKVKLFMNDSFAGEEFGESNNRLPNTIFVTSHHLTTSYYLITSHHLITSYYLITSHHLITSYHLINSGPFCQRCFSCKFFVLFSIFGFITYPKLFNVENKKQHAFWKSNLQSPISKIFR